MHLQPVYEGLSAIGAHTQRVLFDAGFLPDVSHYLTHTPQWFCFECLIRQR